MKVELIIDNKTKSFTVVEDHPDKMFVQIFSNIFNILLSVFFVRNETKNKKQSGTEICQNALRNNAIKLVESLLVIRPFNSNILLEEDVHLDIQQLEYFGYATKWEDTYGSGITSSTLRYYTFTKKARDFLKEVYVRPTQEGEMV